MAGKGKNSGQDGKPFDLYQKLDRLEELLEDLDELGIESRAQAEQALLALNAELDALESAAE
jgi:hypothetical protein